MCSPFFPPFLLLFRYPELVRFVKETSEGLSLNHFIIHARKAFLKGLSPAQNRDVPPLKYDWVFQLAEDFPHLQFSLNGGVKDLEEAKALLARRGEKGAKLEGIMIGRAAYKMPWHTLADADRTIFGESENPCSSRRQLLTEYAKQCDDELDTYVNMGKGQKLKHVIRRMVKPLLGLFYCEPGATKWRRQMDQTLMKGDPKCASEVIFECMKHVPAEVLDAAPHVRFNGREQVTGANTSAHANGKNENGKRRLSEA